MFTSEHIKKISTELDIPKDKTVSILTDNKGKIQQVRNAKKDIFITTPTKGATIEDFFPGALDYLNKKEIIYLPNIQASPSIHADLYIHGNIHKSETLFMFVDVSKRIAKEKKAIKDHNTKLLKKDKTNKEIVNLAFLKIGGLILKHISDERFIIISEIPEWFYEVSPKGPTNNIINLNQTFPFLETFYLYYLAEKGAGAEFVRSGSWIQQKISHEKGDMTLQSLGMQYAGDNYIIIIPGELDKTESKQELIQKARENVLAYEKLEKQEKKLKELLIFKQSFNAIISHDFRSPISALSMSLDLLTQDDDFMKNMNDENREIITMMQDQLIALNNYNRKVYAWSQLEKEGFELEKSKIDVKKLFTDLAQKFTHKLNEKNLKVNIKTEDNVDLYADRLLISQALSNLMENSIKFSNLNSSIDLIATSNMLCLKDHGIGMNEEQKNKLLEGGKNKSRLGTNGEPGSGLGMTIVKKVIESHGFKIDIASEVNKGSEFIITFNNK
jgi:signal transduction histidine kinase